MQQHPPLATPDPAAYHRVFDPFHRGAFVSGRQVRIVHARQLHEGMTRRRSPRRHPVLVVPARYIADDATFDHLAAYAHARGNLVLGPRTGCADHEARVRHESAPGRLTEAAGVSYDEFSNLAQAVPVDSAPGSPLRLPQDATATRRRVHRSAADPPELRRTAHGTGGSSSSEAESGKPAAPWGAAGL
jgi:beta-galactosidase